MCKAIRVQSNDTNEYGLQPFRGKEIIQAPGIIVESGGNLNIDSNGKN